MAALGENTGCPGHWPNKPGTPPSSTVPSSNPRDDEAEAREPESRPLYAVGQSRNHRAAYLTHGLTSEEPGPALPSTPSPTHWKQLPAPAVPRRYWRRESTNSLSCSGHTAISCRTSCRCWGAQRG